MPPVPNNTGTLRAPGVSPFAGEIVPVKWFVVELTDRPEGHVADGVAQSEIRAFSGAVRWFREFVFGIHIRPDTD